VCASDQYTAVLRSEWAAVGMTCVSSGHLHVRPEPGCAGDPLSPSFRASL
jgi:hypothetical protein